MIEVVKVGCSAPINSLVESLNKMIQSLFVLNLDKLKVKMPRRKTKGQIKKAEEIPEGLESLTYELTHEEAVARMNYLEKEEERYKHTLNDRILDFLMR